MVAVKIPQPNSSWDMSTMADLRPNISEIRPAPKVPQPNPVKNVILAIVDKYALSQYRSNSVIMVFFQNEVSC